MTTQPTTNPLDSDSTSRNGKIAHLPRRLRDRINQALYNRTTAKYLVTSLNQMPEVKAVLAQYFDGRPLIPHNIYEWKHGGYRDWLHRRQILEQQRELAADARDLAGTAEDMADSLFGMLTLDYAQLLMNRDKETPEAFEKKRKALGDLAQDVVRLRRCHLNARRVEVQEARLERDNDHTDEQLLFKFAEWSANPEVRRACILAPMEKMRRLRQIYDLPPAPEDPLVEKEVQNDPHITQFDKKQTETKTKQAGKTNTTSEPSPASPSEKAPVSDPADTFSPGGGEGRIEGAPPTASTPRDEEELDNKSPYERALAAEKQIEESRFYNVPAKKTPDPRRENGLKNLTVPQPRPDPLDAFSQPVHRVSPLMYNFRPPAAFNTL